MTDLPGTTPDLTGRGTSDATWTSCRALARLPVWDPGRRDGERVVVVAPHPDDEILGVGGTIARLCRAGVDVELVAVTDGERSHPGRAGYLRAVRPAESAAAAARLGIDFARIHRLGHPDGDVDESRLEDELDHLVGQDDLVLAPWAWDGHPDHDATGRAAARAGARVGAVLRSYLVWAWHWGHPSEMPWDAAVRVDLIGGLVDRKREAVSCFRSQIALDPIVLPAHVRRRLVRPYEVILQR